MVSGTSSHRAGRLSIALTSTITCDDKPFASPQRKRPKALQEEDSFTGTIPWHKAPTRRLHDALQECADLDRELRVLETSGYTRVGVFAKPLAMKPKCENKVTTSIRGINSEAQDDTQGFDEDEDLFYKQFYDEQGRTLSEQLLRGRMRVLALVKLVHGQHSTSKAHAELELGETYARFNLWKQAESHASIAANLLRNIELETQKTTVIKAKSGQKDKGTLLQLAIEFFYAAQCDEAARGHVVAEELMSNLYRDEEVRSRNQLLAAVFDQDTLENVFNSEPKLHWQQLLLRLEAQSEPLHQHLTFVAARLPPGVAQLLNTLFNSLDTAEDGIVPFHTFLDRLQTASSDFSRRTSSAATYLQELCTTLQRVLNRVGYHSLTWTEVLTLGGNCNLKLPVNDEDSGSKEESPAALLARVKLLLSRVYLRRGQLEEAVRYVQVAIVERERVYPDSSELVIFYLVAAEALARRGRQIRVLGQQSRRDRAERWLQTTEGSRCLRSRALEEVERASGSGAPLLSKKEAEAKARTVLMQELTISPLPSSLHSKHPGNEYEGSARTAMDEAFESCNKAWELQERHFGLDHVTTAAVHVSLAQVHLLRSGNEDRVGSDDSKAAIQEAIRSFEAAITIYENACNGPVPASAFLRLELAKLYQQDESKLGKARVEYELVGRFFASFSSEFAGSESTKRECSQLSLDAFRQWMTLSRTSSWDSKTSLEDQRVVLAEMYAISVNGYGEFSLEACECAGDLARMLHRIGTSRESQQSESQAKLRAAVSLLRTASYIAESLLGTTDRRSRKLHKDAIEIESELRTTASRGKDDVVGHEWLVI